MTLFASLGVTVALLVLGVLLGSAAGARLNLTRSTWAGLWWCGGAAAAGVLLTLAVSALTSGEAYRTWDAAAAEALLVDRDSALATVMAIVTSVGDVEPSLVIAALGGALVGYHRRDWVLAAIPAAAIVVSIYVQGLVEGFDGRPMPPPDWAIAGTTGAFPSGGVIRALLALGLLACALGQQWTARADRAFLGALVGGAVGLEAASRLVLGRHWVADVLGGAALGAGLFAAFLPLVRWRAGALLAGAPPRRGVPPSPRPHER